MSTTNLIHHLDGVRETGPDRWIARCPGHDDKSPSLSLRLTDDGRWLLHCFAGCDVGAICGALGLSLADLMPQRLPEHCYGPQKPNHWHAAREALRILSHESLIVAIAGDNIAHGMALTDDDRDRVLLAANRIRAAQEAVQ